MVGIIGEDPGGSGGGGRGEAARSVIATVVVVVVVVILAVLAGYSFRHRRRRHLDERRGSSGNKNSDREGFFDLNETGMDMTCNTVRGNVNRFGYACGLPSGVVAHWKFDSIAPDGSVYDLSSSMLHLHRRGTPQLRYDEGRTAMWLDGSGAHFAVKTPRKFMLGVYDGFSVSFWYKKQTTSRGGPSAYYEPLVMLYKDAGNFVAVTDHHRNGRNHQVGVSTSQRLSNGGGGLVATTTMRPHDENADDGQWTHCIAVFRPDKVRLVRSRARLGDVDDRTQSHDLTKIDYVNFDKVAVGAGPPWLVVPSRTVVVRPVRGFVSDMRVHGRALDDAEMAFLLHTTSKTGKDIASELEVKGDMQIGGNANVQRRLHFKDRRMDPSYNWRSNNSDTYFLEKREHGRNDSSLDLTINDDASERFRVLGNSCREGPSGCGGPGVPQHEFRADGRAYHKGDLEVGGNLDTTNGGVLQAGGDLVAGGALRGNGNLDVRNPGGGRGGSDGGRLHTFHRDTNTHLSLEELDDNVYYDMKTHKNGGDVASLMKTRNGDVYVRNRGGYVRLDRDGNVRESGRERLCLGGRCMGADDMRNLVGGVQPGDYRATGSVRSGGSLRSTASDGGRLCIGGTCVDADDLRNLKKAMNLSALRKRFADKERVAAMARRAERSRGALDDRLDAEAERGQASWSEVRGEMEAVDEDVDAMSARREDRRESTDSRIDAMAQSRDRRTSSMRDSLRDIEGGQESRREEAERVLEDAEEDLAEMTSRRNDGSTYVFRKDDTLTVGKKRAVRVVMVGGGANGGGHSGGKGGEVVDRTVTLPSGKYDVRVARAESGGASSLAHRGGNGTWKARGGVNGGKGRVVKIDGKEFHLGGAGGDGEYWVDGHGAPRGGGGGGGGGRNPWRGGGDGGSGGEDGYGGGGGGGKSHSGNGGQGGKGDGQDANGRRGADGGGPSDGKWSSGRGGGRAGDGGGGGGGGANTGGGGGGSGGYGDAPGRGGSGLVIVQFDP